MRRFLTWLREMWRAFMAEPDILPPPERIRWWAFKHESGTITAHRYHGRETDDAILLATEEYGSDSVMGPFEAGNFMAALDHARSILRPEATQ